MEILRVLGREIGGESEMGESFYFLLLRWNFVIQKYMFFLIVNSRTSNLLNITALRVGTEELAAEFQVTEALEAVIPFLEGV